MRVRLPGQSEGSFYVSNTDYNAKGQRTEITYGNGVTTEYVYDHATFRLTNLNSPPARETTRPKLQKLSYTYDPVGNIVEIYDDAHAVVFHDNGQVEPRSRYGYDALYRLTSATGRELEGLAPSDPPDGTGFPRQQVQPPNNVQAVRSYLESYDYDPVGNILKMVHTAGGGGWNRRYSYAPGSNRLLATSLPGDPEGQYTDRGYAHDAAGNMTEMPHLRPVGSDPQSMYWGSLNHLRSVRRGPDDSVFYTYDAGGQRTRKVRVHGSSREERIYFGAFELYREYTSAGLQVERESLSVMDGTRRIALVDTKTLSEGTPVSSPSPIIRYQLDNHLGSACVETNETGAVISYEEYLPYGETSYWAESGDISLRRYRYTGKERDEETGLYYHGARYYAPWLARWTAADPAGLVDGPNLYAYVRSNPIALTDPNGRQSDRRVVAIPSRLQGDESVEQLHAIVRATGYDFSGTPVRLSTGQWFVGELKPMKGPATPSPSAPSSTTAGGTGAGTGSEPGDIPSGGIGKQRGATKQGVAETGTMWGGANTAPKDRSALDRAAEVAGLIQNLGPSDERQGVTGGIHGGRGAHASRLAQAAYVLLVAATVLLTIGKAALAVAKAVVKGALAVLKRSIGAVKGRIAQVARRNAAKRLPISVQKQAGHIPGTPQYANRIKGGKTTSSFFDAKQAESVTREAWEKGTPLGADGKMRLFDFGKPVGLGPGGGGYQTQVRVSIEPARDFRRLGYVSPATAAGCS